MTIRIALTTGEPAGIGPDICVVVAQRPPVNTELVIIGDQSMLEQRARDLKLPLSLHPFSDSEPSPSSPGKLSILQVGVAQEVIHGKLNTANAEYVLEALRIAIDQVMAGKLDALVTGPVHKGAINEAGIAFTGHTEFLAAHCKKNLTVMMLATEGLRVALATTHLPLAKVPSAINKSCLLYTSPSPRD